MNKEELINEPYLTRDYKVKPFDNLSIKLNSLNQSATSIKGQGNNQNSGPLQASIAQFYLTGYIVNRSGEINIPHVGVVKVSGLSVNEIEELLEMKLKEYLKYISVSVKLINFRITVLGEVGKPGVQYVYENKITLLQAISNASDFTPYSNIKRIKLVREEEGQVKTVLIDASKSDLLSSDYYFLQPNDMIYVEPIKAKVLKVNSNIVSVTFSAISIILVIVNLIRN